MGATASRSSSSSRPTSRAAVKTPSPPASCTAAVKTEYSETRLFTMPDYSESARMAPGSTLTLETFQFRGQGWRVDVDPAGSLACSGCLTVSVTVVADHGWNYPENMATKISIDILDESGERAAFGRRHKARPDGCGGFGFLSVSKAELEASSCIPGDSLTISCTISVDILERQVGLVAGSTQSAGASAKGLHPAPVLIATTAPSLPVTSSSSALSSPTRQPTCGFRWRTGGRLRRGQLRDAFGVHRYTHVGSSLDDDTLTVPLV
ncbi:hypothetical protein D1007_04416 [Hordeum vulgare]|nr:hypothetical protein D1007_04416 [Hordeum vulgare]